MRLVEKCISGLVTICIISIVVFFMFQIIPGDPVLSKLGAEEIDQNPDLAEKLYKEFNLDKSVFERFKIWIKNLLKGDFGNSFIYNRPTLSLISERFKVSLGLAISSILLTALISIPLSFFLVKKGGSRYETSLNILSQIGMAVPSFWLAIMLMWIFSFKLKIFPTRSSIDFSKPWLTMRSLALPTIALSVGNISIVIRYLKNAINEEKVKDYVTLAKSKGIMDTKILETHVFINTLIPMVTVASMVLINLIMGSILVENVFNIQGIGSLLVTAIREGDYPVSQTVILFYSVLVVLINLLTDFMYMIIDPRIDLRK